jgi:hypothetical protein
MMDDGDDDDGDEDQIIAFVEQRTYMDEGDDECV